MLTLYTVSILFSSFFFRLILRARDSEEPLLDNGQLFCRLRSITIGITRTKGNWSALFLPLHTREKPNNSSNVGLRLCFIQ